MDIEVAPEVDRDVTEDLKTKYLEKRMINPHDGHHMKPIDYVLQQAEESKQKLMISIDEKAKKIEAAINYFSGLKEIFSEQRDLFLKKLNADFDVLQKMLDRKRSEL